MEDPRVNTEKTVDGGDFEKVERSPSTPVNTDGASFHSLHADLTNKSEKRKPQ